MFVWIRMYMDILKHLFVWDLTYLLIRQCSSINTPLLIFKNIQNNRWSGSLSYRSTAITKRRQIKLYNKITEEDSVLRRCSRSYSIERGGRKLKEEEEEEEEAEEEEEKEETEEEEGEEEDE